MTRKVAVITGGAGGIGRACASRLADDGFAIALVDVQQHMIDSAVAGLRGTGAICVGHLADVRSAEQLAGVAVAIEGEMGRVDALLNIAGGGVFGPILDLDTEGWETTLGSSLTGTFLSCRTFGALMMRGDGGAVVNMASLMALRHLPGRAAYAAAKAGVIALTKVAASEWAQYNIRVNALAPGYIATAATASAIERGVHVPEAINDRTPMRRMGEPHEVAAVAAFLVSDAAAFVTGQVIVIDGGYSAYGAWWPTSEPIPGLG